ncbi:medium-chain acyl-CoA ligase ACSF2, mitochondrial [Chelonus insularis]|uniref:medium-chain acyl-CoA ligase ACSF2, mitochondrial n=1 Tax=Chelonus insularis TaxID=460826 RepID=UPI00158EC587|nr:medium-chain acyl-CoA ligase ACSF2, mitochondrial [Chelonus insularis]
MFVIKKQFNKKIWQCGVSIIKNHKHLNKWYCSTVNQDLSYRFYPGELPIVDMTIGQAINTAVEQWPHRECLVSAHQGVRLTYAEVLRRADKLAAGLKKLGLKKGDRVGLWGPNDYEWMISFVAISRAGFIMVGINPAYQQKELNYCLQKVEVSAVIAPAKFRTQDYGLMLLNAKNECLSLQHIILWSDDYVTGTRRLSDIESLGSKTEVEAIAATQDEISPYDGCNIQFTSGTTGYPKAPLLSHRSFVNNGRQTAKRAGLPASHHKVCLNVPFFHAFGMIHGFMAGVYSGSTLVLESPTFNPKNSIDTIAKEKCSVAYGTPTMWVNMLDVQDRIKAPIDSLKLTTSGGANVSPNLLKEIRRIFHVEAATIVYGLTETTAMVFQTKPGDPLELADFTVGRVHDHVEVMVVDEKGSIVPIGTPGELLIRGYAIMKGYWNDPESTSKTINKDGWLKTGDKFILHANGYGEVIGRLKDMIIRGGENIFPKEIESFLESHPNILEAHVFGVSDDVYGEEVCASIRLKENSQITANDLKSYAKGKIAHFKIPRYIEIVNEFPKTTSGKIQKFKLKEQFERNKSK